MATAFAAQILEENGLPDLELVVQERDGSVVSSSMCYSTTRATCLIEEDGRAVPLPIVSPSKTDHDFDILAPSGLYWHQGIDMLIADTENLDAEIPWESKVGQRKAVCNHHKCSYLTE